MISRLTYFQARIAGHQTLIAAVVDVAIPIAIDDGGISGLDDESAGRGLGIIARQRNPAIRVLIYA